LSKPNFPDDGIAWHGWSEATIKKIAEKDRPVLLLVMDPDPIHAPFLRGFLDAAPKNARLCELLHREFMALYVPQETLPEELSLFGAGSRYHLAILSPSEFTPLVGFHAQMCEASEVAEQIVVALEGLLQSW
jgi:hypothetical protein